jgi:CRISPR-associated protein Cmr6
MKAAIPMTGDVAALIGPYAEGVENRSLLLDKYVFHKQWPTGDDKRDEASRWSFLRIADGASALLTGEARKTRKKADGRDVQYEKKKRLLDEARIAEQLASVKWQDGALAQLRAEHSRRFASLLAESQRIRSAVVAGRLEGRLALNLADGLVTGGGMCLDRLFGLPYIPGSAVKGVTRSVALLDLKNAADDSEGQRLFDAFCAVFGTAENDFRKGSLAEFRHRLIGRPETRRGQIVFMPAYPLEPVKIVVDLVNVHYPKYYESGRSADLAAEAPRPNPFPVVEVGALFGFCIAMQDGSADSGLLEQARRWLETALTIKGLGAKTASGYGWFSIDKEALSRIEEAARLSAEAEEKERADAAAKKNAEEERLRRRETLTPVQRRAEDLWESVQAGADFKGLLSGIASLDEDAQRALLLLCATHGRAVWDADYREYVKVKDNPKKREKNKAWRRIAAAIGIAEKLGESIP